MSRRLRIVVVVSGLLMAEYFLQSLYYEHIRRPESKSGLIGWFKTDAIVVPKSDQYIADLDLDTCKFPVYYDKSHFGFRLKDDSFVETGNWRERNKQYEGREDARIVYNALKKAEASRSRILEKNPYLPPITRNLTFVHIGTTYHFSVH